jgi:hypothetical protein
VDAEENKTGRSIDEEIACCMLFRRHVLESVGLYDERIWRNETKEILVRILQDPRYKDRGARIRIPLYNRYKHADSLTQGGEKGGV